MSENSKNIKLSVGVITIVVLLICQLIAFAFGYGSLCAKVDFNKELISEYRENQADIMGELQDLKERVGKIEILLQDRE